MQHVSVSLALRGFFAVLVASMLVSLGLRNAQAETEGRAAGGEPYVSGGVGLEERETLSRRRQEYSLWIATAVKKSGNYLADAQVRITDSAGKLVLDTRLDGPWLLVGLQPGRYTATVSFGKQTLRKTTALGAGDHRQLMFHFDRAADDVSSGM
ncbi:MAG: carboxypeptidase-like regulatory domain-containing protein [Betaproteobacteria bacterium]|nr:carboxypeptidase-like regulatory domain-containing protein [Betaproteobacteria bacterium]